MTVRPLITGAAAVTAVGAGVAVWSIGIERHLYTRRYHDLDVLPADVPGLRILHISDVHMAPWQHHKRDWIARMASEVQPDLVINTGDNLGHPEGLDAIREAFAPLRGIPGVFVHGSNDVTAPVPRNPFTYLRGPSRGLSTTPQLDSAAMDRFFMDDLGWHDLNNAAAAVDVGGIRIDAFGVSDAHRDWDDLDALPSAIDALPRARRGSPPALRLGVTHAPYRRVLDRFVSLGADAIFAGHTHGGQVRIPGSPSALVANCDIPLDQARGLSTWTVADRTVPLNVSAGLGHSIYAPVRLGCRPEVSVIELRRARAAVDSSGAR